MPGAPKTYNVATDFECPGIAESGNVSVDLIDHITFPDSAGSTYTFQYEVTGRLYPHGYQGPRVPLGSVSGRLASVTLPSGGTISYDYSGGGCKSSDGGINPDGTPGTLTRTTADGSKTYARSIAGTGSSTAVTDELQNQSTFSFTSSAAGFWYETEREVWQGSGSGIPLLDRTTQYNGQSTPAQLTSVITQTDVFDHFNGGSQSQVENLYDPSSGLITKSTQMDPDQGGATLVSTSLTYNTVGTVAVSDTRDAAGNFIATTNYGYDEGTPTPTSNIPQHGAPTGARGNHTSTHISIGDGTTLDSTATYYDTGVPIDATTPNGKTQYTYDPTQAFVTNATLPTPSSGISLSTSASFDPSSGAQISATGMNAGQTTQAMQYDRLLRPTIITTPDGGQTTYTYSPNQVGVSSKVDGGRSSDQETFFDSYGRTTRSAVFNGTIWYLTDTCYDAAAQLQYQSIPYASANTSGPQICSAANAVVYSHDALGRTTSVANPDGSSNSATYNSRSVKITNSPGGSKIIKSDLLGRTSAVCELSYNGSGADTPQDCGMDLPGTGFLTNFSYDFPSHTTTITQGEQQRSVQTDGAGRTVSVSEPERGTTTYGYQYNGTGLIVTRKRPRANQTNSSSLTTTKIQYDSLGRVVSISYDDSLTPNKKYMYDTYDPATDWSNISLGQSKGQLTFASTSSAGTQFAYDPMGRITQTIQCLPGRCGNSAYDVSHSYSYYLSGSLQKDSYFLNAGIGPEVDTNYTVSVAGEITGISNTLDGVVNDSGAILSNIQSGPLGPSTYQYGNGLNGVTAYDTSGRLSGKWLCNGSTQINCSGGTQLYGTQATLQGARVLSMYDTALSSHVNFGYDEFDRLTSATYTDSNQAFSYDYDRYGNRLHQNVLQGSGPAPQLSINTTNNQVDGYTYDAVGNLLYDGTHSYTYDAEGNVMTVDGGASAYTYDALNHRVQAIVGGINTQYAFGIDGNRVSTWDGASCTPTLLSATTYWNGQPVSVFDGSIHFQHQDGLGTERVRTAFDGTVETSFQSLPWGDSLTASGSDNDPYHFAGLDHDADAGTEHAQFRQYSSTLGRWMSPDPYDGSYDFSNPQSFNRYTYALNNPVRYLDPSGLDCIGGNASGYGYDPSTGNEGGYYDISTPAGCAAAGGFWNDGNGSIDTTITNGCADNTSDTPCITVNYSSDPLATFTGTVDFGSLDFGGISSGWAIAGGIGPSLSSGGTTVGGAPNTNNGRQSNHIDATQLPSCYTVEADVIAGDLNPFTPSWSTVTGLASDAAAAGSGYKATQAAIYAGTTINTKGGIGLIQPLKSSTYRGILGESSLLSKASAVFTLGTFDAALIHGMRTAWITPCR